MSFPQILIPMQTSDNLQDHLHRIEAWFRRWRVKVNGAMIADITFTLRWQPCPHFSFNTVPDSLSRLPAIGFIQVQQVIWSPPPIDEWVIYTRHKYQSKYTKGVEFWNSATPANSQRIQSFQLKVLRTILNTLWYISNLKIHNDLNIPPASSPCLFALFTTNFCSDNSWEMIGKCKINKKNIHKKKLKTIAVSWIFCLIVV